MAERYKNKPKANASRTSITDAFTQGLIPMLANAGRGSVAATFGAPADILGLLDIETPLPTSERLLEMIPAVGDKKAAETWSDLGGFIPTPIPAKAIAKGAVAGGKALAPKMEEMLMNYATDLGGVKGVVPLKERPIKWEDADPAKATDFAVREGSGTIVPKTVFDPQKNVGSLITTMMSDISNRNTLPEQISGQIIKPKFAKPTTGGFKYARDADNIANDIAYASGDSVVQGVNNKLLRLDSLAKELSPEYNGRTLVLPFSMPTRGIGFSTMPVEAVRAYALSRGMRPKDVAEIDEMVRNAGKGKFQDFVGLLDPRFDDQFYRGEGLNANKTDLRKAIFDKYALSRTGQEIMGYDPNDLLATIADPNLVGKRPYQVGEVVLDIDPRVAPRAVDHPSYPAGWTGQYAGSFANNLNIEDVFPEISGMFNQIIRTPIKSKDPTKGERFLTAKQAFPNAVNTIGWGDFGRILTQREADRLSGLLGQ